jgi:hypothetical protein
MGMILQLNKGTRGQKFIMPADRVGQVRPHLIVKCTTPTPMKRRRNKHLQDNNGDIVVCSLQQHLSFEGDDLALLCEVKEHMMSKRGLDGSPARVAHERIASG